MEIHKILQGVLFDMDGVICHTNPYHDIAWKQFLASYGIASTEEQFQQHMYGKHNSYILRYFFNKDLTHDEVTRLAAEKEALFRDIYAPHITPLPGLLALIDALEERRIPMAVATSAPIENMELILPALGLHKRMGSMLAEHHVAQHKPHPEVYLQSAANLGVSPQNCIVFEDSKSGVQAGTAAGAAVVGVLTSHTCEELPPCDRHIADYKGLTVEELVGILENKLNQRK